jgi:RNA polymerase sigma factor (TIGR02999 family)
MRHSIEVTRLLLALREDDPDAWDDLVPLVYDELRRIAHNHLRKQREGHTLNTTALVHEAFLKLTDSESLDYRDRAHFFAVSARAMRQILVDHARKRATGRRGGDRQVLPLDEQEVAMEERAEELLALDEALTRLGQLNERLCRVVEYRFFGGLTEQETAQVLGVTDRTVRRDWTKARLWLYAELEGQKA